ncbi:MAG: MerR family transcriptional regulator [Spirochaetes bacterium]|nr:MerR family transcriptional regulator [Spirochaetota bacterium]
MKDTISKQKETFTISQLASELDITPSAIRFYEEKGLILPRRTSGNQRIYTKKDRARLKLILRGKRFGASLDEIAEMIGPPNGEINEKQQIERSLYYIDKRLRELQEQKKEILIYEKELFDLKKMLLNRLKQLQ